MDLKNSAKQKKPMEINIKFIIYVVSWFRYRWQNVGGLSHAQVLVAGIL
jgi:hypothetical protein